MPDRLPAASLAALRNLLAETVISLQEGAAAEQKLRELRQMYEPYVQALSEYLLKTLSPWFRVTVIPDNCQTSPWEKLITEMATPIDTTEQTTAVQSVTVGSVRGSRHRGIQA